jgi:hypothetical protein
MRIRFQEFIDDIPAFIRAILCFFIGHSRMNGGWEEVDLCTRCHEFVPKKKNNKKK